MISDEHSKITFYCSQCQKEFIVLWPYEIIPVSVIHRDCESQAWRRKIEKVSLLSAKHEDGS